MPTRRFRSSRSTASGDSMSEGAGHAGAEFYFNSKVEFPKGANLDCKPEGDEKKVEEGCSASTYYSTTIQNKMIKDRQYIEPGKVIEFKDETRFDQTDKGWKGQDGNFTEQFDEVDVSDKSECEESCSSRNGSKWICSGPFQFAPRCADLALLRSRFQVR